MFVSLIAMVWESGTLPHRKCVQNNWMNEKCMLKKIQVAAMVEELHLICNLCIRLLLALTKNKSHAALKL